MGEVLKIFISATSADLGTVRTAAKNALLTLGYMPIEQEHFGPAPETILEMLRRRIEESDAVLHIVGECHGAEPPVGAATGAEPGGRRAVVAGAGGERRSYTQWEYHYARELKKPVYVFVCDDTFPYTQHAEELPEARALQRAHRAAVVAPGGNKYELIPDRAALDARLREIQLANQRLGAELGRARDWADRADPLQRYYQNLREQFANYDNVGLPVPAREGKDEKEEPIKIRDLFVPPHCSERHIRPAELDAAVREGKTLGEPLLPLLEKPGARIVLLADPGMGKSTVIQYLIATLADDRAPAGAPGLRGAIPFPFILRELARLLPDDVKQWNWDALLDAFCRWDPRSGGEGALGAPIADRATFRSLVGREDAFFLIDGLDEIGDPVKRVAISDAIIGGFGACRNARWLITSRVVGYEKAEVHRSRATEKDWVDAEYANEMLGSGALRVLETRGFEYMWEWADALHYLAPFNNTQQRAFAEHWYMPRMGEAKGAGRAREFIAAVHQHPHTRVIGRIPNLLYLLALLYRHQAQLPHGRALVYEAISEAYLESIPLQRLLLGDAAAYSQSFPVKEQLLAIVGMKMQQMRASRKEGEDGDILVSRAQLGEWLAGRFDSEAALQEFLDHVARHSGLLLPRGEGVYGFAHLSFQEYYAACHLRSDFERIVTKARPATSFLRRPASSAPVENEERLFADYATQSLWHEPLLFLVEKFRGNKDFTEQLIEWMFPQFADDPGKGADWMPIEAARLLATLSIDPEVALELPQRDAIWQTLWTADISAWSGTWEISPSLVVAGSVFQSEVLQAAAAFAPKRLGFSFCPALSDLTPLAGLDGLQKLNFIRCVGLSDLMPLARLTGLQDVHLCGCSALVDITPLAGLTGLRRLVLMDCTAVVDITPLAGLTGLQTLEITSHPWLADLTMLAGLSGLRALNLSGCSALADLLPLAELTGLRNLDLRYCSALDDLTPLAGLTGLRKLYLDSCKKLRDLAPLAGLARLRKLQLGGCTGLDKEDVAKLRKALPKANILF